MTTDSLMEQFVDGVAAAVTDVREKVVEEGWYGRAITDTPAPEADLAPTSSANDTPNTWEGYVQQATQDAPDHKEEIVPDNGIDR